MRKRIVLAAAASVMLTGCYNNPEVSRKLPGDGPDNYMSKPAVGPGTVSGGSTAGPQPQKADHGGHGSQGEHAPQKPAGGPDHAGAPASHQQGEHGKDQEHKAAGH